MIDKIVTVFMIVVGTVVSCLIVISFTAWLMGYMK